jgi:WD40 repeat protein
MVDTAAGSSLTNPYVGPVPFLEEQKLYGRTNETDALYNLLISKRIVLLFSPSGAGKTSLIQSALVPSLRSRLNPLPIIRLDRTPNIGERQANRYLLSAFQSLESRFPPSERLKDEELSGLTFHTYFSRRMPGSEKKETVKFPLIVLDQFEELFTLNRFDWKDKEDFLRQLGEALGGSTDSNEDKETGGERLQMPTRWALLSMREDYVAELEPFLDLIPTGLAYRYRLEPLERDQALEAVRGPAGEYFQEDAAERLVDNLRMLRARTPTGEEKWEKGRFVEPVHLQVVCQRLWDKVVEVEKRPIALSDIATTEKASEVEAALSSYYDLEIEQAVRESGVRQRDLRDWIQQELITRTKIRTKMLHEPASMGKLDAAVRLLVKGHVLRIDVAGEREWIELAHDRLVNPVLKSNEDWRRKHLALVQRQAKLWAEAGKSKRELLFSGEELDEAERFAAKYPDEMGQDDQDFLQESRLERKRVEEDMRKKAEIEQKNKQLLSQRRMLIALSVSMIFAFLIVSYFMWEAKRQRIEAINQACHATMHELAAAANSNLEIDPELSILLAMQAVSITYSKDKTIAVEAEEALHRAVQTSRVRLTLKHYGKRVVGVALSPDGQYMATGSDDGTAKIWDAISGKDLLTLSGYSNAVVEVAFSPDGQRVATVDHDSKAKIWDAVSGKDLLTLSGHTSSVMDVDFSPDGQRVATASDDRTAKIWDAVSGKDLLTLSGHSDKVNGVAFSPDGQRVATASDDRTAKIWDAVSGKDLLTLSGHSDKVNGVAFSPDCQRVATVSHDSTAKIWDALSGKHLLTLSGHTNSVFRIAFNPKGEYLATSSADGTAKVWHVTSGREMFTLSGHTGPVEGLSFSKDGDRLATASWDATAKIWNVACYHPDLIHRVAFSPDGQRVATASADRTAKIWDVASGKDLLTLSSHRDEVRCVAFSPDGQRVATASADRTAKIWDVASGKDLLTLSGHRDQANWVTFSPDGRRLATASEDGTAMIWDAVSGKDLLTLPGHWDKVSCVAFSPDGQRVATASHDGTAMIWDAISGKELLTLSGHSRLLFGVAFSPDGRRLATASLDKTAKIWDAVSGEEELTLVGHANSVIDVAFSPDGRHLATASWDRTARLWDVLSGKETLALSHTAEVSAVTFSPDGARLATAGSDKKIHMYVLNKEKLLDLAKSRVTRKLTDEECRRYLHQDQCP